MTEKVGRNDLCPCGSGKKYKNCCLLDKKQSQTSTLSGKRKFTAKLISGGGMKTPQQLQGEQEQQQKMVVDYNTLMERSFGDAIHATDEKPPMPSNPLEYLPKSEKNSQSE